MKTRLGRFGSHSIVFAVLVEIYANPIVAQKEIGLALNPNNLAGTAYLPFADYSNTLNFNTWNTTHDYAPNGYSAEVT